MAGKLDQSSLKDVLAALKKVTKPYQLGIQLKVDSSELDTIEKNHPRDIDRQKTEVVKYWLRNSPDASWTTLANAVEKMGGRARLANELRARAGRDDQHSSDQHQAPTFFSWNHRKTVSVSLEQSVQRNILILGKREHGKSTLGYVVLNSSKPSSKDKVMSRTHRNSAVIISPSQHKQYMLSVYDHNGLFEGLSSDDSLFSSLPDDLSLVVVVLKQGCRFDADERGRLEAVVTKRKLSQISAVALTHCESLSEKERKNAVKQFQKDHPSIAKLMGKGILTVGFPDSSHVQPGSPLSQRVEEDKMRLRQLVYSCDELVSMQECDSTLQDEGEGGENGDQPQTSSCCSIM